MGETSLETEEEFRESVLPPKTTLQHAGLSLATASTSLTEKVENKSGE